MRFRFRARFMPLVTLAILGLLLAACSDQPAAVQAVPVETAAVSGMQTDFLIVGKGNLNKGLEAVAAANGDSLRVISQGAGLAAVTTANPDAYAKFGSVVRDVRVQWLEPVENVALEIDAGSPPFSDSTDTYFNL